MYCHKRIIFSIILFFLPQDRARAQQDTAHEIPGLHNLVQLSADVYSGSEPAGEEAFAGLKKLGVQTIVSVDGATPNIDMAKKYGIQYFHVPFGYDAIPLAAQLSLTRAARDAKTPLYVHCHHGKHRGPAAAAIVCRAKGIVDLAGSLKIMHNAGTSRDYKGLWRDVETFKVPSADMQLPDLVEMAQIESLAAAMARIDRNFDNLKLCAAVDWKAPADHPDLVAQQEALQLQESLHESTRRLGEKDQATDYDATFREWLTESDTVARTLYESLQGNNTTAATAAFITLQNRCQRCHVKYRDQ